MASLAMLRREVARYYSSCIERFGATPYGVDWASGEAQMLRFAKLMQLCGHARFYTLADIGCGYGALRSYIDRAFPRAHVDYLGIDLSDAMIESARAAFPDRGDARFVVGERAEEPADYAVASGIFNVMPAVPRRDWERLVARTLTDMRDQVRRGFAINFKEPRMHATDKASGLYLTEPSRWVEFIETRLDCRVRVLSGYGLAEFTLIARCT